MNTRDRVRQIAAEYLRMDPRDAYEAFQHLEPKLQAYILASARPIAPPALSLEETLGILCARLADVRREEDEPDPVRIRGLLARPSR